MGSEGGRCVEDVRLRFDGLRRNPWDEPECGHHYARAMSAWSGLVALSGFRYSGPEGRVSVTPSAPFQSFWSTGGAWGTFTKSGGQLTLAVLFGKLPCRSVE